MVDSEAGRTVVAGMGKGRSRVDLEEHCYTTR